VIDAASLTLARANTSANRQNIRHVVAHAEKADAIVKSEAAHELLELDAQGPITD
jgi:hypothetical protein